MAAELAPVFTGIPFAPTVLLALLDRAPVAVATAAGAGGDGSSV